MPRVQVEGVAAVAPGRAGAGAGGPLLDVRDYKVWFPIRKGLLKRTVGYVKAVDGVSFSIAPARSHRLNLRSRRRLAVASISPCRFSSR